MSDKIKIPVQSFIDYEMDIMDEEQIIEFFQKLIRKHLRKGQRVTLLVPLPKPHFVELTG